MKIIQVKCASCGASLDVDESKDSIKCEYCGTPSRIQRRTGMFRLGPLPSAAPGEEAAPVSVERFRKGARLAVLGSLLTPLLITGAVFLFIRHGKEIVQSVPGLETVGAALGGSGMSWEGIGLALLTDVNGDGSPDPVGRARYVGAQDRITIVAADATTGKRLWESESIGSYSDTYQGKLWLSGKVVVFSSPQGELHAFALAEGKRLWRIPVGEKTDRLCLDADGIVGVRTTDGLLHRIRLADGTAEEAEAQKGTCRDPLPHDREGGDPALRPRSSSPRVDGMSVSHQFEAPGTEIRVVTGTKAEGTRVPMVAALNAQGKVLWKSEVPGADRLQASESAPELVALASGRLYAIYQKQGGGHYGFLVAFDLASGRRLWEVTLGTDMPLRGLQATAAHVFVSSWGSLEAYDAQSGQRLYTIGD